MKIFKPKFWDTKKSTYSVLLYPITFIVELIIKIKKKLIIGRKFNIPIICIGNIYIGGTGKTPISIMIAKELEKKGKKPVIIRKFYKEHLDEHNLIRRHYKHLILNKNRTDGILDAENKGFDIIILDDGFQDYHIKKDMSVLCFNKNQLIGNGLVFPSGPLRENIYSIKKAQAIIINGGENKVFEDKVLNINKTIKIFYSNYKPVNLEEFRNKELLAIAGIGNPSNFFNLLTKYGLNIKKKYSYPDHYQFKKRELINLINIAKKNNFEIITTEKDYLRIKDFNLSRIKYLKVEIEVIQKDKFVNEILNIK
jgi:tetraacyldisaccharide 4'-kinase